MVFRACLVNFRAEKGLSQAQLGQILGVSAAEIELWERGETIPAPAIQDAIYKTVGICPACASESRNGAGAPPPFISAPIVNGQPYAYGGAAFASAPPQQAPQTKKMIVRIAMLFLFAANFLSLSFGLFLVNTEGNNLVDFNADMWRFWLMLPIPIASIIFGILCRRKGYKTTKNIVAGVIFAFLLLVYGSFGFLTSIGTSPVDTQYISEISATVDFALPTDGKMRVFDFENDPQAVSSDPAVHRLTQISFADEAQEMQFMQVVSESDKWISPADRPSLLLILSFSSQMTYNTEDAVLIYNRDLQTFNALPTASGTYSYIYISYSAKTHMLTIEEYEKEFKEESPNGDSSFDI